MATQAPVKTASNRQENAVPRAGKPRSKGRIFDYSRFRLALQKPQDFDEYLSGYPNKSGLNLSIYRLLPKIDFGLIGVKEHTIRKTFEPDEMNADFVLKNFGRGKYQFRLNDKLRDKGQTEVATLIFALDDPEREPVYDIRTLCLGASENIDEINRLIEKGALIRDAAGAPRVRTERDGPVTLSAVAVAPAGSSELVSREVIGQVLLKLIGQGTQNPKDMIEQSISIAKLLRPESPASAPVSADQIAELVLVKLGRNNPAQDPFQTWERIQGFIEKTRGPVAAVSAVAGDNMLAGLSEVLKSAAVLIPEIIQGVTFLQQQKARLDIDIERRAPGRAAQSAPGAPVQQTPTEPMNMADRIAEVAELAFIKIGEGINGFDFAAFVCQWHPGGLEVYRFLEPHGAVGVLGLLAMNPQAAPILADAVKRPQLEKFLGEFFSYDPEPDEDEDEDESSPVARAS